jgi:N-acetylmuramoyl-L-alanine amidase
MREINEIVIHCSDTPPEMDIGAGEIKKWHVEERKWDDIGYHFVIRHNGTTEGGRPIEEAGAHARGHNKYSIGICLVGGKGGANFTFRQYVALNELVKFLAEAYKIPPAKIVGHCDLTAKKSCPNFDVGAFFS